MNEDALCKACGSRTGNLCATRYFDRGELKIESMIWICMDCKTQRTIYQDDYDTGLVEDHPWVIPQL